MADDKKRDDYAVEMGEMDREAKTFESAAPLRTSYTSATPSSNNPILPILSYCGSSILMTVTNKYVLSGFGFNLNFFLLCIQVRRPADM